LREQEEARNFEKAKKRQDYLTKLDENHLQNARIMAKIRAEKERILKEEADEQENRRQEQKKRMSEEMQQRAIEEAHKKKMRAIARQALEVQYLFYIIDKLKVI
jgi:hypothetical protein